MQKIFKFDNIFKSVIWGGNRISEFKGVKTDQEKIGESWELSPMKGAESVVSNGDWKGVALPELIARDGERIMGRRLMKRFDGKFPLLIKFIDSADDLSVQVHPDDGLALKRHNSFGKNARCRRHESCIRRHACQSVHTHSGYAPFKFP